MTLSNIVETKHSKGIEILLKGNKSRFTILGIVLKTTPKAQKIYIRKWLKHMSKKYSNILFIYHSVSDINSSNMSLLTKDTNKYPLVYHIVDVNNIIVKVENANEETLHTSFEQVKGYYIKDMENNTITNEENDINDDINGDINGDINDDIENDIEKEQQINTDRQKIILKRKETKFDKNLERKKLEEKVNLLNEHAEEFKNDFLTDVKERKLLET